MSEKFLVDDWNLEVELVPICASCGYPIEDDADLVDTSRGEMHEHCAIRVYPQG